MTGKQTALMPGNEDRVGYWLTPPDLMAKLQAEFDFNFDACPYPRPAGFDGLKESWGQRTWCNPPFWSGGTTKWVRKAISERDRGQTVCIILPVPPQLELLIRAEAECRSLGRPRFLKPNGQRQQAPGPICLFVLRPKP